MAQMMKDKFRTVNKLCGYDINYISDQAVRFNAHILVGKIMRKCIVNVVPTALVSLVV